MSALRIIQWACAVVAGCCGTVVIAIMLTRESPGVPDMAGYWAAPLPILLIGWFVARWIENIERRYGP